MDFDKTILFGMKCCVRVQKNLGKKGNSPGMLPSDMEWKGGNKCAFIPPFVNAAFVAWKGLLCRPQLSVLLSTVVLEMYCNSPNLLIHSLINQSTNQSILLLLSAVRGPPGPEHLLGELGHQVGGRGRREPPAGRQVHGAQEGEAGREGPESSGQVGQRLRV